MPPETLTLEVVVFEIPGVDRARELSELLAEERLTWVERGEGIGRVVVLLRPDEGDLAALMRTTEQWVADRHLFAIRFSLDGRDYVLEAGDAIWPAAAA